MKGHREEAIAEKLLLEVNVKCTLEQVSESFSKITRVHPLQWQNIIRCFG